MAILSDSAAVLVHSPGPRRAAAHGFTSPEFETLEDRFVLSYTVTDLGLSAGFDAGGAFAINQAGDVAGLEWTIDLASIQAFIWRNGVKTELGTLGGARSSAYGINNSDQVVGAAGTGAIDANGNLIYHAFRWQNGVMTDLSTLGGNNSFARGINNAGQVMGYAETGALDAYGAPILDSFLWQNGVMTDLGLGSSYAFAINDAGQAVGTTFPDTGGSIAYIWQAGTVTYPDGLDTGAIGVNAAGTVVGSDTIIVQVDTGQTDECGNPSYEYVPELQAAEWQPDGTLTVLNPGNFGTYSINASGQIVGANQDSSGALHAVLWQNGTLIDLWTAVPAGWMPVFTYGINDASQIAGSANGHAVRLDFVPDPTIAINDVSVTEDNSGTVNASFTVTLSFASSNTVTAQYATADSTAIAGSDYTATSGTLTFAPGEISKTITVSVLGDRIAEPNETFNVYLSAPTLATISESQGVGTILDDEPRISINDVSKKEGNSGTTAFVFTVSLSTTYDQIVTVRYATANGTAKVTDHDYWGKTGMLTFAAGQTSQNVTILVFGDPKKEADETFYVNLSSPSSNALIATPRGSAPSSTTTLQ